MRPKIAQLFVPGVAAARAVGGLVRRYAGPLAARFKKEVNGREPIVLRCEEVSISAHELSVVGWALARTGIDVVEVFLDDVLVGAASYGLKRPDVRAAHPELPGAELSGFSLKVPLVRGAAGRPHRLRVVARSFGGGSAVHAAPISAEREPEPASSGGSSLALSEAGAQDAVAETPPSRRAPPSSKPPSATEHEAPRNQRFFFCCDEPPLLEKPCVYGSTVVRGWTLVESGLDRVAVYVDDAEIGVATLGTLRTDVAAAHPGWADAEHAGWQMTWDTRSIPDGPHKLSVRLVSRTGELREVSGTVIVDNATPRATPYERWIELYEARDVLEAKTRSEALAYQPRISILTPAYNVDPDVLKEMIESVKNQAYANWQLCICDDGSKNPEAQRVLTDAAASDPRIRIELLTENAGISAATNRALGMAEGEFVALLDADDVLPPHALYFVAKALNDDKSLDLLYSDEDKIDGQGRRYEPFFKPDFSPDLLLSMNYICHLTVVRTVLLRELGGFQSQFDGSQDYDVTLRVTERTQRIFHVPKVLYHWRAIPGSTAVNPATRMSAHAAARRAIEGHLERCRIQATVEPGASLGRWRVRYALTNPPDVAVIVPCGGKVELLLECLTSVLQKTTYPRYQVTVVDNSKADDVRAVVEAFRETQINEGRTSVNWVDFRNRPFNFALLNNLAVKNVTAPLVLFLNDDCMPINDDWLGAMVEHAVRPVVGAVGAKLLYPDGTLQHAGVVMGIYDNSGHSFKFLPGSESNPVYFDLPHVIRNTSAVTAACLMTRREVFLEVGGFDDVHLAVAFQDTDLCLKLGKRGYRVIYTPHARLFHYESKTKDEKVPNAYEVWWMRQSWAGAIASDPFYNPNLTRRSEDYSLCVED
jgi:GT2 family glycosyltransferase